MTMQPIPREPTASPAPCDDRITVAIPYYQGLGYLQQAIASVLNQTVRPKEIIICDDSSNGEAQTCIAMWPEGIRHIRNPRRLGIGGNWNQCLGETKTEFVVLLHGDDCLMPGYIERMLDVAARHPEATGIFCEARIINAQGRPAFSLINWIKYFLWPYGRQPVQEITGETGMAALLRGDFIICSSVCYRLNRLGALRFSEQWQQALDIELFARLVLEDHTLVGLRETLVALRRHPLTYTSVMEKDSRRFHEEAMCLHEKASQCTLKGWERAARIGHRQHLVKMHFFLKCLKEALCGQWRPATRRFMAYNRIFTPAPNKTLPEI